MPLAHYCWHAIVFFSLSLSTKITCEIPAGCLWGLAGSRDSLGTACDVGTQQRFLFFLPTATTKPMRTQSLCSQSVSDIFDLKQYAETKQPWIISSRSFIKYVVWFCFDIIEYGKWWWTIMHPEPQVLCTSYRTHPCSCLPSYQNSHLFYLTLSLLLALAEHLFAH